MSDWIIFSEDGRELGRSRALQAKTAFLVWHSPSPPDLRGIEMTSQPDGSCRIVYGGEVFVLKSETRE